MTGLQQFGCVRPGGGPVGSDHHTLAGGQSVVLDHPGLLTGRRTESVQGSVQNRRTVDGFTAGGPHPGRSHHVLGEGFGALDPGGLRRRSETGDTGSADRIGHTDHQWHLRSDHHQVGAGLGGQFSHFRGGGDVDVVLGGQRRGARIAGRDGEEVDVRVIAQPEQQGMFAGTGSDHEDAHRDTP